jgi:hypothetical protein
MAKKRAPNLSEVDSVTVTREATPDELDAMADAGPGEIAVTLEVPLADPGGAYVTRHVDMRLCPRRAATLGKIFHGLKGRTLPLAASQAETVNSPARALMYLLDAVEVEQGT